MHYLRRFPYDVIVFHEGLGPSEMERLRVIYPRLLFHKLDKTFLFPPDHVDRSKLPHIIGAHPF